MPLNVVIPSNLDTDFTIDIVKSKIYNNSIIIGAGVPVANPPVEEKVWLYAKSDNGGVAGDYAISHVWEPATLVWEPLGAAVDFRLTAVSVDANTGEVTFTITDPASGATSTITTDLTNLVDVQETLTVLAEVAPGQLNYTDEDAVVNVIDISGLRDTGQTAQRVEIIGDTFNIIPNGVDTRVVVDNASSTATFVDGTTTAIHYTGDNVLGMGISGDSGVVMSPDGMALSYVIEPAPGAFQGGVIAADPGLSTGAQFAVERDTSNDSSQVTINVDNNANYRVQRFLQSNTHHAKSSISAQAPSGNTANEFIDVQAIASTYNLNIFDPSGHSVGRNSIANTSVAGETLTIQSTSGCVTSYQYTANATDSLYSLYTHAPAGFFDTTLNAESTDSVSKLNLASKYVSEPLAYVNAETDGMLSATSVGSAKAGSISVTFAETKYVVDATSESVSTTASYSADEYSNITVYADGLGTPTVTLSSNTLASSRNIVIAPASIEIGAGDVASNAVGGADGDVLVRFGTGSEVRYASIGSVVGAELNVNTATPALEVVVGGSVVDTVGLVDVLDAFNVHQFYAIP